MATGHEPGTIISEWGGNLRAAPPDEPAPAITGLGIHGRLASRAGIVEPVTTRIFAERPWTPVPDEVKDQPGYRLLDVTAKPWPVITASAPAAIFAATDERPDMPAAPAKPPYRIPLMAEIAMVEWNGFTAVTTFAGGGGTCAGLRWAGYRVAWANEFVKAAGDTYAVNHPDTVLDRRDVRDVTAADVLAATGLKAGELDLLDGSPPCDPFSQSGRRHEMWGKIKQYSEERRQRTDDLFFEFARLVDGLRPRAFMAENVAGLVRGTAKGYFKMILAGLKQCGPGYVVEARLLDASWLGVPQARKRIFFVGVRADLAEAHGVGPAFPKPLGYRYTVRDALPWIGAQGASRGFTRGVEARDPDRPSPAITSTAGDDAWRCPAQAVSDDDPAGMVMRPHGWFPGRAVDFAAEPAPTILGAGMGADYAVTGEAEGGPEAGRIFQRTERDGGKVEIHRQDEPAPTIQAYGIGGVSPGQYGMVVHDTQGSGVYPQRGDVTGEPSPPITGATNQHQVWESAGLNHDTGGRDRSGDVTDRPAPTIVPGAGGMNAYHWQVGEVGVAHDPHPGGGFDSAGDVTDEPMPTIEGGRRGRTHHAAVWSGAGDGIIAYHGPRDPGEPAPTIVGQVHAPYQFNGLGVWGAARDEQGRPVDPETGQDLTIGEHTAVYQAWRKHFARKAGGAPVTCRKLTIGELRRLGGFPDDYALTGSYSQRWERVGQSVPPPMARAVAEAIRDRVLRPLRDKGAI